MPKYLFTSDQRIGDLPNKLKLLANYLHDGGVLTDITDKSENNNATTLQSYYNIYAGNQLCNDSCSNPISAIRNFVLKFQFPNTRTPESFYDCLQEGTLLAPFRVVVSILDEMINNTNASTSSISLDEILWFVFCDSKIYADPLFSVANLVQRIFAARHTNIDLKSNIEKNIEWKQYDRQVRELFLVLTYASACFTLDKGVITFSKNSPSYQQDKTYIDSILSYDYMWYPSNTNDFNNSRQEYINYMNTTPSAYSVIQLNKKQNFNKKPSNLPLQQIFYGAPGTGKSHRIEELIANNGIDKASNVFRTTFHPDSDYSTFVGAYKPTKQKKLVRNVAGNPVEENGFKVYEDAITYKFIPQTFLKAYIKAWKSPDEVVVLVIEEINRGNCAQIFGDLFQLLDRKDGKSEYPIKSDEDLCKFLKEECGDNFEGIKNDELCLPPNLYIWATMNTSDQSLFPIDSAFKRRWDWKYIPIDTNKEQWGISLNGNLYSWSSFLDKINKEISDTTSSEDKQLGFYFCKAVDGQISAEKFVSKVLFYLYNDVFKDYGLDREFFKDKDNNNAIITFRDFFMPDGNIEESMVEKLLKNLSVEVVDIIDHSDAIDPEDIKESSISTLSETQLRFWQGFNNARSNNPNFSNTYNERKPLHQSWMDLALGSSNYWVSMSAVFTKSVIRCGITIDKSEKGEALFSKLKADKDAVNDLVGVTVSFSESSKYNYAKFEKTINLNDETNWSEACGWLMDMALKMKQIKDQFGI